MKDNINITSKPKPITNNVQCIVYVSFIVEKDGSLSDIEKLQDIVYGCGEEAVRVVSSMPNGVLQAKEIIM